MAVERLVRARQLVQNCLQEPVRIGCGDEYATAIDHANHEMPALESLRLDNIAQGNTQFGEREISRDDPGHLPMPAHGFGDDDARVNRFHGCHAYNAHLEHWTTGLQSSLNYHWGREFRSRRDLALRPGSEHSAEGIEPVDVIHIAARVLPCLERECQVFGRVGLQRKCAQSVQCLLGALQLQAGLARDLLRQRLVRCLDIAAQSLLDKCVDAHASQQHDGDKEQVDAEQLKQERSTHQMQHSSTPLSRSHGLSSLVHYIILHIETFSQCRVCLPVSIIAASRLRRSPCVYCIAKHALCACFAKQYTPLARRSRAEMRDGKTAHHRASPYMHQSQRDISSLCSRTRWYRSH